MLYHVRCGNQIGIRGGIEVISQIGIDTSKKTLTTSGYIVVQAKKKVEKDFFCPECLAVVPNAEIYSTCAACGERMNIENAHVIRGAGAVLCGTHIKRYSKTEETYLLSEIIDSLKGK